MPYFYNPEPLSEKAFFLPQDESRHLSKTLRAKVGDLIHLLDGQGTIIEAEISNIPSKGRISCFLKSSELIPEPRVKIHLYIAPPRSNIMSSLIKQCVELGVWEIHLLECEFSVSKPKDKINLYEKEIISAAKQSGNPYFPEVKTAIPFKEAISNCKHPIFYGAVPQESLEQKHIAKESEMALWVGPEGGFSANELKTLQNTGSGITIGNWVLRVETACVGLVSILNQL